VRPRADRTPIRLAPWPRPARSSLRGGERRRE
jgi:hypothetical protein